MLTQNPSSDCPAPTLWRGFLALLTLTLFALGLAACQSTPEVLACQEADWFELGRIDGNRGAMPAQVDRQTLRCQDSNPQDALRAYKTGYQVGLTSYCTEDNAFYIGRTGLAWHSSVCPESSRANLDESFEKGRVNSEVQDQISELKKSLRSLEQRAASSHEAQVVRKKIKALERTL